MRVCHNLLQLDAIDQAVVDVHKVTKADLGENTMARYLQHELIDIALEVKLLGQHHRREHAAQLRIFESELRFVVKYCEAIHRQGRQVWKDECASILATDVYKRREHARERWCTCIKESRNSARVHAVSAYARVVGFGFWR